MAMMTETKLVLFEALEYALINHVGNVESCGWVLAANGKLDRYCSLPLDE